MSNGVPLVSAQPAAPVGLRWTVAFALGVWFVAVVTLAAGDAFVTARGTPPIPMGLGAILPLVVFFAGLGVSREFRDLVAGLDVRVTLGMQAWRFAGFVFLALYANGLLPGSFAIPAGLGDMAIAATAPWLMHAVIRRPRLIAGRTFAVWNALGILDLVVALATGAAGSVAAPVTTQLMVQLPLVMIPDFLVPVFIMLHVAALMQARRLAAAAGRLS